MWVVVVVVVVEGRAAEALGLEGLEDLKLEVLHEADVVAGAAAAAVLKAAAEKPVS